MKTEKQTVSEPLSTLSSARASPDTPIILFIVGAAFIAILLFAYYAITWRNAHNFRVAMDVCTKVFCDLADYYYPMGEAIFQTKLPIEGFVYSPFVAILFAIFPPFGLIASLLIWGFLQATFVILYLFAFRHLVPAKLPIQLLFVAIALSSFPLLHNLEWGQVGILYTVSILGALALYERGHSTLAAILLAFGLSFKFFPILFLVPFAFRRDIRFLSFAAAACVTFLFVIPCLFLGVDGTLGFYNGLLDQYRNFDWVITNYNSQHFPHVVLRLTEGLGANLRGQLPLLRGISYGIAAINLGLVYLIQRARLQYAKLWSFHIIFLTVPFLLLTSWPVDLVYTSFAQGLLAWRVLEGRYRPAGISWRNAAIVLLLASILISSIFFFNLIGDHILYGGVGFIFWSNLFLLAASYMELLPATMGQLGSEPASAALLDVTDTARAAKLDEAKS